MRDSDVEQQRQDVVRGDSAVGGTAGPWGRRSMSNSPPGRAVVAEDLGLLGQRLAEPAQQRRAAGEADQRIVRR